MTRGPAFYVPAATPATGRAGRGGVSADLSRGRAGLDSPTMSTDAAPRRRAPDASPPDDPPLANGDRITADEFLLRHDEWASARRVEVIEGGVHIPSFAAPAVHAAAHDTLDQWLLGYKMMTRGLRRGDGRTDGGRVRLDGDNLYRPDLTLRLPESAGGRTRVVAGVTAGPPELVCEVATCASSVDLHRKLDVYRRNGVGEYLVWRTRDAAVDWFALRDGRYDPIAPDPADGLLKSGTFPGLWLSVPALLAHDLPALAAAVERGRATPDHAAFAARLSAGAA